jgi:hypothetical protein
VRRACEAIAAALPPGETARELMPLALTPRTAFALEIFATDGRRHFAYHEHVYALLEDAVERLTV